MNGMMRFDVLLVVAELRHAFREHGEDIPLFNGMVRRQVYEHSRMIRYGLTEGVLGVELTPDELITDAQVHLN